MSKKTLGIAIPYYKNSEECEEHFKILMGVLEPQLTDDMILCIYEDGQESDWLWEFAKNKKITVIYCKINKGVSFARNAMIDYLINQVNYILFIDSDDIVDDDYLTKVHEYCADNTHDIIETGFNVKGQLMDFNPKEVRSCCASTALKTEVIGNHRFKENIQIGEDTEFMNEVIDLSKHRKKYCRTNYFYKLGVNPNSLIKRYQRKEIGVEREVDNDAK